MSWCLSGSVHTKRSSPSERGRLHYTTLWGEGKISALRRCIVPEKCESRARSWITIHQETRSPGGTQPQPHSAGWLGSEEAEAMVTSLSSRHGERKAGSRWPDSVSRRAPVIVSWSTSLVYGHGSSSAATWIEDSHKSHMYRYAHSF